MHTKIGRRAAIGALASAIAAGGAPAQPRLNATGGGTGDAEMDHARMGGGPQGAGGGTPSMRVTGGGTGDAETLRPPAAGLGAGFPQGGRITGNAGGDGGLEIQHGHTPAQGSFPRRRSNRRKATDAQARGGVRRRSWLSGGGPGRRRASLGGGLQ